MNGNAAFVIILIVIYLFAVYGKHIGLFRTLIPIASLVFSVCLPALVLPDFSKRLMSDGGILDIKEAALDLLSFVAAFFIVRALFRLLLKLLTPVLDLPVLKQIDRTLGLFAGLSAGFIVVWMVFFLGLFFLGNEGMEPVLRLVDSSAPLKFLYNHNPIMTLINRVVFAGA